MAVYVVLKHCDVHLPGEMIIHTKEDEAQGIKADLLVEQGALRKAYKGEDTSRAVRWGVTANPVLQQVPPVPIDFIMEQAIKKEREDSEERAEAQARAYAQEAPVEELTKTGKTTNARRSA